MMRAASLSEYAQMPRATSTPSGPTMLTVSPRSKRPTRARHARPATGSCRCNSARTAPSSTAIAPAGFKVPAIHCLRVASGVEDGTNQVQRAPSSMRLQRMLGGALGDAQMTARAHGDLGRGDLGLHAARTHLAADPARHRLDCGGDLEHPGNEFGVRVLVGIGGVQAVDVRQQHQTIGAHHLRHARGQPVVVAVADLGGRHGVVFVDHRHRAQRQQRVQRAARIQIAAALLGIAEGQQDLRHRDLVGVQQFLVGVRETNLPDRGRRLALLELEFAGAQVRGAVGRARWRRRTPG